MKLLMETNTRLLAVALFLLRCIVGLIFFVAGAGKALAWFGGMGMKATVEAFKTGMDISAPWAYLCSYTEFIGGALLIAGLLTRPAALALTINMLVATILVGPKNFYMGGGAYPCSLMVCSLVIFLAGPMMYSLDALLWSEKNKQFVQA